VSAEELVLRASMPAEQVDAMLRAGPARRHYNPRLQPLLVLLEELAKRPALAELAVDKPGLRLRLRARAGPIPTPEAGEG
jgi:oxaloacetate decarboxylase alpha subunit